jgi:hypothetical protein
MKKQVYNREGKAIKGKFVTEPDWTKNQIFAVDNHTCEFPDGKNYEEVLELIEQGSEDVIIWEPFEYDDPKSIVEKITDMVAGLDRTYPAGAK